MEFAQQPLVSFIREALWRQKGGTSTGRAAVMVGAGFSRNADPASGSSRPFPTWAALTRSLCDRLYPATDHERRAAAVADAAGTSGALRLAQEYEAVFGRFQLDDFVRSAIPDEEHYPGELHSRLLTLPWADVFTTNWDTLLERAQVDVFERSYEVVRIPSQIPSAAVPRIVKLHGSLPAHQPFVLTEEDYRTYPKRFAPFVNLVQQAMMENTFVLVGFSGDDPNFLYWSGWVRDNLAGQAPKIYLVGWLALSPHRRRMLEDRGVVPIDLSELPQGRLWPETMRHRNATEWFLASLEAGRPPRASNWPRLRTPVAHPPHLWPVSGRASDPLVEEPHPKGFPDDGTVFADELSAAASAWAVNRAAYPGWVIAPNSVRSWVWHGVEAWLSGGLKKRLDPIEPRKRLFVLGEMLWRFDVALVSSSIDDSLHAVLKETLALVDVESRCMAVPGAPAVPLSAIEWTTVCAGLAELARRARNRGAKDDFERWLALLAAATKGDADGEHTVRYEQCLWSLQALDHPALEGLVDTWSVDGADAMWAVRKAGLLAGIDRLDEARSLFRSALARIRRERRRGEDDHAAMSRESWAMWLALAFSNRWTGGPSVTVLTPDPFDRWRELRGHPETNESDSMRLSRSRISVA